MNSHGHPEPASHGHPELVSGSDYAGKDAEMNSA
jgi:hypothetical protein